MRLLAIDYGLKRTGLAVCDKEQTVCSPYDIIKTDNNIAIKISEIIKTEAIGAVIVGLPLNMDGSKGTQAEHVLKFVDQLKNHIDIPIHLQDERLSSFAAEQKFQPAQRIRHKKNKSLDAVAAAQILEDFLQNLQNQ
jgi:putative Holliday junction resolvase